MGFATTGTFCVSGGSLTGLAHGAWDAGAVHDFWFDTGALVAVARTVTPTGTGLYISGDSVYHVASGQSTVSDFSWPYTIPPHRKDPPETVSRFTINSGVIIPATGNDSLWTWQGNGTGALVLQSSLQTCAATGFITAYTGSTSPTYTFVNYDPTSLRYALITGVDARISGLSATASKPIYSTQDHTAGVYVRNTGCWAYGVDLTPISPWNSCGGQYMAGTLVSPKHVLFATHYQIAAGSTIRFVSTNNTVATRTITGIEALPGYTPYYPDITLGGLDSDVPAGISFATILPASYTGCMPGGVSRCPALNLDAEEKALVSDLLRLTTASGWNGAMVQNQVPIDNTRIQFYESQIGGDSGNPTCIIVNGKLILLTVATFGGPGYGTNIAYWKDAINTVMANLGGGYTLTEADLSTFATYT